ncbi:MAG: class I SAM-dependent methyltransferase [Methanocellales archaeon]
MKDEYNQIQAYYDELAREYDQRYQNPELAYMRSVEDEVLLREARGRIVDIGCGTGRHSILLANLGYSVIGIDISLEMIKIARSKGGVNSNINFLVASAEALPFKSSSVNSVISIFGALNHVVRYNQAFEEIARVLKPEGVFIFSVVNRWNLNWWLKCLLSFKWKWLTIALRSSEYSEGIVWTHYYSASELKKLLQCKFKNLKLGCLLLFIYPRFKFHAGSLSSVQKFFSKVEDLLRWRYPFNKIGYYILGIALRK